MENFNLMLVLIWVIKLIIIWIMIRLIKYYKINYLKILTKIKKIYICNNISLVYIIKLKMDKMYNIINYYLKIIKFNNLNNLIIKQILW